MENISNKKKIANSAMLAGASVIWGIAFVVQTVGGKEVDSAYAFNAARMLIGAIFVYLATFLTDKMGLSGAPETKTDRKRLWKTGISCGVFLCIATNLQQIALTNGDSAGRAGFLTAFYILFVPVISALFLKQRCGLNVWAACVIALIGLYFLSVSGKFEILYTDVLLLGCALAFAIQIIIVGKYGMTLDSLRLSAIEFLVCGLLSIIPALFFEMLPYEGGPLAWLKMFNNAKIWLCLLYLGILSCGVGYTLQVIGQKRLDATLASIIMSLESVFSALAGWVFLKESMSFKEISGCVLIFAGICLAQINFKKKKKKIEIEDN